MLAQNCSSSSTDQRHSSSYELGSRPSRSPRKRMKRVISARSRSSSLGSHSGVCALDMRVFSRFVDLLGLRAEFPVVRELAYLNAGTDGPLPTRAVRAVADELEREAIDGRASAHFARRTELNDRLRAAYARALGAASADVALTTCTSEGIAQVVGGLARAPGR